MVNIDTVYQTVLALANKEQRGYITPQEFNLYAEQSQLEIIEQYFYDINQFDRTPDNDSEYSNMVDLIHKKLSLFKVLDEGVPKMANSTSNFNVPAAVYKLGSVYTKLGVLTERVDRAEVKSLQMSELTKPTENTPVHTLAGMGVTKIITMYPAHGKQIKIDYIKFPQLPRWGFTIVGERAMFNPLRTNDFDVDASETSELVYRILVLAGITINRQDVSSAATALQVSKTQQEKQ
jgi:hypothetical protein